MDELSRLAPEDAFRLALNRSPYSVKELCERLGWSDSFMRRVLSIEKYSPSYEDIPAFCRTVRNNIVIDWLYARSDFTVEDSPNLTPALLQSSVLDLSAELGDVASRVRMAIADGVITKKENRDIHRELLELISVAVGLSGVLKDFDRKVARHG